jgi:hypothetical protein
MGLSVEVGTHRRPDVSEGAKFHPKSAVVRSSRVWGAGRSEPAPEVTSIGSDSPVRNTA